MTRRLAAPPPRAARTIATSAIASGIALCLGLGGWAGPAAAVSPAAVSPGAVSPAAVSPAAQLPAASGPAGTSAGTGAAGPSSGTSGSGSASDLLVQAQELAGEISADGRQLDELSAAYQAARIRYGQLETLAAGARRDVARASAQVDTARRYLRQQALLSYMTGGTPLVSYVPDRAGQDPSLTTAYAEIISGGERDAVSAYRASLAAQSRLAAQLADDVRQAGIVLTAARSDASQAQVTLTSRQAALAQVKGQLAVDVAAVQASQQQQQASAVQARLASEGQLPTPAPTAPGRPVDTATGPTIAAPAPRPTAVPQTTAAPATIAAGTTEPPATTAPPPPTTAPPTTAPPMTAPPTTAPPASGTGGSVPPQAPGASQVLAYARAQLGKPYQWGGAGPNSFDCSGLVMMAWQQAGIYFPHLAQDQYDMTARLPLSELLPGDLVFFGTPGNVYHVGIYIGNGQMIDAPETGQDVSISSIYWDSLLGGGRVHT